MIDVLSIPEGAAYGPARRAGNVLLCQNDSQDRFYLAEQDFRAGDAAVYVPQRPAGIDDKGGRHAQHAVLAGEVGAFLGVDFDHLEAVAEALLQAVQGRPLGGLSRSALGGGEERMAGLAIRGNGRPPRSTPRRARRSSRPPAGP